MDDIQLARYDRVFDGYALGDDYLSRDSFTRHTRTLARLRGKNPESPSISAFDEELGNVWDQVAAIADTDHDGRVSRDEWREAAKAVTASLRAAADAGAEWPFEDWIGLLYRVIDGDGDGHITKQEYADWLEALGLAANTDLDGAFAGFDKNSDGNLSMAEFSDIYHTYWTDFDPNTPAHRWIGP